jgi:hypothetical protein
LGNLLGYGHCVAALARGQYFSRERHRSMSYAGS